MTLRDFFGMCDGYDNVMVGNYEGRIKDCPEHLLGHEVVDVHATVVLEECGFHITLA